MGYPVKILFVGLLALAGPQTKTVTIPQTPTTPMQVGDLVCVKLPTGEDECGKVLTSGEKEVSLEVSYQSDESAKVETPKEVAKEIPKVAPQGEFWTAPVKAETKKPRKKETVKMEAKAIVEEAKAPIEPERPTALAPVPVKEVEEPQKPPVRTAQCDVPYRLVASLGESMEEIVREKPADLRFMSGFATGTNFYFGLVEVSRQMGSKWGVGVMPIFSLGSSINTSVSVFGGFIHSYLWLIEEGEGLQALAGIGAYRISMSTDLGTKHYLSSLSAFSGLGYAWSFKETFFALPRLGFQYLTSISGADSKIQFTGIKPTLYLEAGVRF